MCLESSAKTSKSGVVPIQKHIKYLPDNKSFVFNFQPLSWENLDYKYATTDLYVVRLGNSEENECTIALLSDLSVTIRFPAWVQTMNQTFQQWPFAKSKTGLSQCGIQLLLNEHIFYMEDFRISNKALMKPE